MNTPTRTPRRLITLAAALALTVAACGGAVDDPGADPGTDPAPGGPAADQDAGLDGEWRLVEGQGPEGRVPIPDDAAITLSIDGTDWGGTAACNSYGGSVTVDEDGQVSLAGFAVTEMACPEPGLMDAEAAYLAALTQVDTARIEPDQDDEDHLVLTGPEVRLRFAPVAPVADAALIGTTWRLDALLEAPSDDGADTAVSSVLGEAVLELADDGSIAGSTGCNRFAGEVELDGDQLRAGPLATTRMACDEALTRQEQHVLAVLDGTSTFEVEAATLTIVGADGRGLIYRAEP